MRHGAGDHLGGQITGLTAGSSYYVQVTAGASTGYATNSANSATATVATEQLNPPTAITVTSGTSTTSGSLTVNFTAPSNAPAGQTYTAAACTGSGTGCGTAVAITTAGGQITGPTAGSSYYVQVTAVASTGYVAASANSASATKATEQLNPPTAITVTSGTSTTSGSLTVNFTAPSNAPAGQTYTAAACTGSGTGCGTAVAITTAGGQITGLTPGTKYYVQVTAVASSGWLSSSANVGGFNNRHRSDERADYFSFVGGGSGNKTVNVTYAASSGAPSGTTYTLLACQAASMTGTCSTFTDYTSGTTQTVSTKSVSYWVEIEPVPPAGYTPTNSAVSGPQTS